MANDLTAFELKGEINGDIDLGDCTHIYVHVKSLGDIVQPVQLLAHSDCISISLLPSSVIVRSLWCLGRERNKQRESLPGPTPHIEYQNLWLLRSPHPAKFLDMDTRSIEGVGLNPRCRHCFVHTMLDMRTCIFLLSWSPLSNNMLQVYDALPPSLMLPLQVLPPLIARTRSFSKQT